jgi:hypothetical protein
MAADILPAVVKNDRFDHRPASVQNMAIMLVVEDR